MIIINPKVPFKTYILDVTDSTNNVCKQLALQGEETALVVAFSQTAGKGRLGRSFYSPDNTGIYLSFLLRPLLKAEQVSCITTAAAVAVARVIDKISDKKCLIKWVNDIYLNNKKVCGILCESGSSKQKTGFDYIIVGIGINLTDPKNGFPYDIKDKAGSIFGTMPCEEETKEKLIEDITDEFLKIYNRLPEKDYMNTYREKSMLTGRTVSFIRDGKEAEGKVININDKAEIVIETEDETVNLFAGEVSLKF